MRAVIGALWSTGAGGRLVLTLCGFLLMSVVMWIWS